MPKHILDVGNCGFDHGSLKTFLERHFDVRLTQAHNAAEAASLLAEGSFDLVLVNRKFDRNGDDGIEWIRSIKSDPHLRETPMLLLSNYADYQQQAVHAGAEPGFGKAALESDSSIDAVKSALR